MNGRYYLFILEGNHLIEVGNRLGYETLQEARAEALRRVDDALPDNSVWVVQKVCHAYCGGDGGAYISGEEEAG